MIAGVPVHLLGKAARAARALAWHALQGNVATAFEHELWLCFFAGVVRQRWADRRLPVAQGPATGHAPLTGADVSRAFTRDGVDLVT
jgi:hypothetical protein